LLEFIDHLNISQIPRGIFRPNNRVGYLWENDACRDAFFSSFGISSNAQGNIEEQAILYASSLILERRDFSVFLNDFFSPLKKYLLDTINNYMHEILDYIDLVKFGSGEYDYYGPKNILSHEDRVYFRCEGVFYEVKKMRERGYDQCANMVLRYEELLEKLPYSDRIHVGMTEMLKKLIKKIEDYIWDSLLEVYRVLYTRCCAYCAYTGYGLQGFLTNHGRCLSGRRYIFYLDNDTVDRLYNYIRCRP
jgi:hypothetical protein